MWHGRNSFEHVSGSGTNANTDEGQFPAQDRHTGDVDVALALDLNDLPAGLMSL